MAVEQWCCRVAGKQAETKRRELIAEGILDRKLRPGHDGDYVLFPVTEKIEGAVRLEFESQKEKRELPRHELIGGIAVMQNDNREEARHLLNSRPVIHSVLHSESPVEGEYRTREFSVLAGEETTKTRHLEYGLRFDIDLSVAYFSARLANERQRILRIMGNGERVLDMFAGVGPFAVTLAKKAGVVFAGDINPGAIHLMTDNIRLNRCRNVIPMLADATHLNEIFHPAYFDRIIMNLPMTSTEFLRPAFQLCREGGTIHYYTLQETEGEMLPLLREFTDGDIRERRVRSYSPAMHHTVYDIIVAKKS